MLNKKIRLFFLALISSFNANVMAQNEPFHGGNGDGFGFSGGNFDMSEVSFEGNPLTVTINQSVSQEDPTTTEPLIYEVHFSETVTDFDANDVYITGVSNSQIVITGSGNSYFVEVRNINENGEVVAEIPEGGVHNGVGNPNQASTSSDNRITYFGADLLVEITLSSGQAEYSNKDELKFDVTFSEPVDDFSSDDIELSGTAMPSNVDIEGEGSDFVAIVSGMGQEGFVEINLPVNQVHNIIGGGNMPSVNTANRIYVDYTRPTVEIVQATGQDDPTFSSPIKFVLNFSEEVVGLSRSSVAFGGNIGIDLEIAGSGKEYTVSVSGMKNQETVSISLDEYSVSDIAGNFNLASVNTDNSVTYLGTSTGINDMRTNGSKIYCFDGCIYINNIHGFKNGAQVFIYDISGKLVANKKELQKENKFHIRKKGNDLYLVKIVEDGIIYSRIVISF